MTGNIASNFAFTLISFVVVQSLKWVTKARKNIALAGKNDSENHRQNDQQNLNDSGNSTDADVNNNERIENSKQSGWLSTLIFNTQIKRIEREREEARLEIEKENVIQRKLEAVVQEETMREIIDLLKPSETQTGDALARAREYRYGKRWKIKTIKRGITEGKKRMEQYLAREEMLGEEKAEKRKKKSVESAFRKWHKQSVGKKMVGE
jgi:hypothetical protein